jgi:hypothetical protein
MSSLEPENDTSRPSMPMPWPGAVFPSMVMLLLTDTADAELDDTARLAHRVAEGTAAGVGEGGHVVDRVAGAAGGAAPEADGAREGEVGLDGRPGGHRDAGALAAGA